jgi:hypothetical protein
VDIQGRSRSIRLRWVKNTHCEKNVKNASDGVFPLRPDPWPDFLFSCLLPRSKMFWNTYQGQGLTMPRSLPAASPDFPGFPFFNRFS